jgi:hypothetical protein
MLGLNRENPMKRVTCLIRFFSAPLLAAAMALVSMPAQAKGPMQVIDFGIYKLNVSSTIKAPGDVSLERNVVSNIKIARQARKIMAQPGRSFGFRFRITDPGLVGKRLTLRTIFPKLTNPKTGRSAVSQDRTFVAQGIHITYYDGYRFDYRWEMAEGIWRFQLLDGNRVLSEQRFQIVVPLN